MLLLISIILFLAVFSVKYLIVTLLRFRNPPNSTEAWNTAILQIWSSTDGGLRINASNANKGISFRKRNWSAFMDFRIEKDVHIFKL